MEYFSLCLFLIPSASGRSLRPYGSLFVSNPAKCNMDSSLLSSSGGPRPALTHTDKSSKQAQETRQPPSSQPAGVS
uniref:Uncharacterized protein n=1 Tax=Picea glauca TaxID=3330 RepID=A0A117NI56_PICGL|nr:hypothetical protein ABT39_MTgene3962 [Picea glauca]QHR91074.1 hypothetical protein Q903MT_gene5106 [Picea sitchensis]